MAATISSTPLNYQSPQFGEITGTKRYFGCRHPSLSFRDSIWGLSIQLHTDLCCSSGRGVKLRTHIEGKVSNSAHLLLNRSASIVYDASSELKSRFARVFQGHGSAKRFIQEAIAPLEPVLSKLNRDIPVKFAVGLGMVVVFMVIAVKRYMASQSGDSGRGSVSDLVKRGQLRSDRRSISRPLKYDDPFNNPFVRAGKKNSIVKICGKVFRLTPVALTEEKALNHQNRRVRAYQWKRPTLFLKEGDPIPTGVDPDTVRWIPANHPFATANNDIDEDFAQKNIYQKRGAPSRVREEHEALHRKMMMEAKQNEQKFNAMAEYAGFSGNPNNPSVSSEKTSGYPGDKVYHGDNRIENSNGELNGFQTPEEKTVQDPHLQSSSHTAKILDDSDSHRLSKIPVQEVHPNELLNN